MRYLVLIAGAMTLMVVGTPVNAENACQQRCGATYNACISRVNNLPIAERKSPRGAAQAQNCLNAQAQCWGRCQG